MGYEEACAWLFEKLPIYQRTGKLAYKPDLGNIQALCEAFGNPQERFPSIHIAGTNGKGSTAHILSSILQEAGFNTGLHTQPHFFDLRERILVNGKLCSERFIVDKVEEYRDMELPITPSFFELLVAFAFLHFQEEKVDIAVIETGLGGRLDATNIITPELSIITNIGHDHMELLGPDLPSIAREKAGIIKEGVPVILGDLPQKAHRVILERAEEMNAPIPERGKIGNRSLSGVLQAPYQQENVRTVLGAVQTLREKGWAIPENAVDAGLEKVVENTGFKGRWQVLREKPLVIADMGHNQEAIESILEGSKEKGYEKLFLVFGSVEGKALDQILEAIPEGSEFFPCRADIPRAMALEGLHERILEKGFRSTPIEDVGDAYEAAKARATEQDMILITGSAFIVAEFLEKRKEGVADE